MEPDFDSSYIGRKKIVEKRSEDLLYKVDEQVAVINQRLKEDNAKVSITRKGKSLVLQATLPLKPGDRGKRPNKQYQIALGIPANLHGCQTAREEAQELAKLIARKTFEWSKKYLGTKSRGEPTFKYIYDNFEQKYYDENPRTFKAQTTVYNHLQRIRVYFDLDKEFTVDYVEKTVKSIESPSIKSVLLVTLNVIGKLYDISADFSHLKPKNYKPRPRNIPNDIDIVIAYYKFAEYADVNHTKKIWRLYRLMFGLMAVYGLRPKEIVVQPDVDWFLSADNVRNTWKVSDLCKTGSREVLPFVPQWVEDFDLKNETVLMMLKERCQDLTFGQVKALLCMNWRYWKKAGIEFKPYDLRHACAVRGHIDGIPVKLAAQNLGHGASMHLETYNRWISLEQRKVGFDAAFDKLTEVERLRQENSELKLEVKRLKFEIQRLDNASH
jgi:integrase